MCGKSVHKIKIGFQNIQKLFSTMWEICIVKCLKYCTINDARYEITTMRYERNAKEQKQTLFLNERKYYQVNLRGSKEHLLCRNTVHPIPSNSTSGSIYFIKYIVKIKCVLLICVTMKWNIVIYFYWENRLIII